MKKIVYAELVKLVNAIQTNDIRTLVKRPDFDTKVRELEDKIRNHDKYITTNNLINFQMQYFMKD